MMGRKKIITRLVIILTIGTIAYFGVKAREVIGVINDLDSQLVEKQEELEEEKAYLEVLNKSREEMSTLEYIERVAREKLGLVREDDIVFKELKK